MSYITFTHGKEDGSVITDDPLMTGYVYLQLKADDPLESQISGYVSPEFRRLIYGAPQYQRKVYEYEALLGQLKKAIDTDDFDTARDLVKAEYDAIHGPSDDR